MSTSTKDRDKIARRLADQSAMLADAQHDLVASEQAWQAAVVSDDEGKLDAAERRRTRAAAKLAALTDVEHRVRQMLDQADADLERQRAEREHAAAVTAHRQAAERAQSLASEMPSHVEQALGDLAVIVDRLRAIGAEFAAAAQAEEERRRQVADAAVALGVQPDLPLSVDRLDAVMRQLPDIPARRLYSAALRPDRRAAIVALGEAASVRAIAAEPRRMSVSFGRR